jgi:hypothetical protein
MARVSAVLLLALTLGLSACASPRTGTALVETYSAELARSSQPFPYIALHEQRGRRLGFVAADHTIDPASATMAAIRQAFEEVRPAKVIIEGFPTEMGESPGAIRDIVEEAHLPEGEPYGRGEAGYAARLAMAAGVPFIGGEPTESVQTQALLTQGFSARDIFFTDMLKLLPQSIRGGEISGPDDARFEDVFARWTVSLAIERENPPRLNLDDFAEWYLDQYGVDYRIDARFEHRADPNAEGVVGRILRAQGLVRDRHLYGVIMEAVKKRERVLVVYGGTHHATLAPALTAALGPARLTPGAALVAAAPSASSASTPAAASMSAGGD